MPNKTNPCDATHFAAFNTCIRLIGGNTKTFRALGLSGPSVVDAWQARGRLPAAHALALHEAAIVAAAKQDIPLQRVPSLQSLLTYNKPGTVPVQARYQSDASTG